MSAIQKIDLSDELLRIIFNETKPSRSLIIMLMEVAYYSGCGFYFIAPPFVVGYAPLAGVGDDRGLYVLRRI